MWMQKQLKTKSKSLRKMKEEKGREGRRKICIWNMFCVLKRSHRRAVLCCADWKEWCVYATHFGLSIPAGLHADHVFVFALRLSKTKRLHANMVEEIENKQHHLAKITPLHRLPCPHSLRTLHCNYICIFWKAGCQTERMTIILLPKKVANSWFHIW